MAAEGELRASGRFVAGDPLRAVAALTVLVYHGALLSHTDKDDVHFADLFGAKVGGLLLHAGSGLFLFFVLSGYVISRPFVRWFVEGGAAPRVAPYLRNRALRIVPAFWVVFTVTLFVEAVGGHLHPLGDVAEVYAFAQGPHETPTSDLIGQAWTLGVEWQFYLVVPALAFGAGALLARRGTPALRRALVVVGATALGVATARVDYFGTFHRTIVSLGYAFAPGVVFAALEPPGGLRTTRTGAVRVVALALVVAGVVTGLRYDLPFNGGVALSCGAIVGGALLLQRGAGRTWRALDNPLLHWLGERSYAIYLTHWGILLLLAHVVIDDDRPKLSFVAIMATGLPLTILASAVCFRYVEVPFLRLRHRWRSEPRTPSSIHSEPPCRA